MTQLFLDMDGVLADFDAAYIDLFGEPPRRDLPDRPDMWERINAHGRFYADLPAMPDAMELWDFCAPLKPIILTGVPKSVPDAAAHKVEWATRQFGPTVRIITCPSKDKCLHGKPGDILVDDWEKYRAKWEDMGGRWITHRTAEESVMQILEHGLGL